MSATTHAPTGSRLPPSPVRTSSVQVHSSTTAWLGCTWRRLRSSFSLPYSSLVFSRYSATSRAKRNDSVGMVTTSWSWVQGL